MGERGSSGGARLLTAALVLLMVAPLLGQQPLVSDKMTEAVLEEVFALINKLRQGKGLPALKRQADLDKLARDHAANMGRQDKFGDDGKNGHVLDWKGFEDRLKASPYKYKIAAENLHASQGFPAAKVASVAAKSWKDSPGHWKTICNGNLTETGVGVARGKSGKWYFVQVFGTPRSP
jgi:uncharacterized protein YkwD